MKKTKEIRKSLFIVLCLTGLVVFFCGQVISEEKVTITGTVNRLNQIMGNDDQIYEISENDKGEELVKHLDMKVRVTGMIENDVELKVITITTFQTIEE